MAFRVSAETFALALDDLLCECILESLSLTKESFGADWSPQNKPLELVFGISDFYRRIGSFDNQQVLLLVLPIRIFSMTQIFPNHLFAGFLVFRPS
mmetsp:Transcript_7338/g.15232  ORF Transcript_7338/g.15232 Transcript_7338/m.15232 type:complete len:96 (+) Transcript_7338:1035-1322(+)